MLIEFEIMELISQRRITRAMTGKHISQLLKKLKYFNNIPKKVFKLIKICNRN